MKSLKLTLIFFVLLAAFLPTHGQKSIRDSTISLTFLNVTYGGYNASGDLAKRFGWTNQMGGEVGYKFKNNFYVYTGVKFLFGRKVKEWVGQNVTQAVFDTSGSYQIMGIGADGRFYEIRFFERGYTVPITVGKIFPVFKNHNPNSGIYVELGAQFIEHKIKIEPNGNNVPALDPQYRPGYDRLTNGIGITQGIGYKYYSNKNLTNFYFGIDCSQNFTQNRRLINYDTGVRDTQKRLDMLFGFKLGWTFPIYKRAGNSFYIY